MLNCLPCFNVICRSGSKAENKSEKSNSKPLKIDNTITKAMVPIATPAEDMPEITLMALCDFLEKRYRPAILKLNFSLLNLDGMFLHLFNFFFRNG